MERPDRAVVSVVVVVAAVAVEVGSVVVGCDGEECGFGAGSEVGSVVAGGDDGVVGTAVVDGGGGGLGGDRASEVRSGNPCVRIPQEGPDACRHCRSSSCLAALMGSLAMGSARVPVPVLVQVLPSMVASLL